MKQFFKFFFASAFGFLFGFSLLIFIGLGIMFAAVSALESEQEVLVEENSILHFNLEGSIPERRTYDLSLFDFESMDIESEPGLTDILEALRAASDDEKIKAIYLEIGPGFSAGFATMKELHDALMLCREKGKHIIAYSTMLMESNYYLASAANEIHLHPAGSVVLKGLYAERMFYAEALKKLGIEVQVFKHGTFKSAVEPFIVNEMSPANRLQVEGYLNSIYQTFLADVAPNRKMTVDSLRNISDKLLVRNTKDALTYGLVDKLSHDHELRKVLQTWSEQEEDEDPEFISMKEYCAYQRTKPNTAKDRIAVLFANGDIQDGGGAEEVITPDRMIEAIRKIGKDKRVKALVLRINSPGGSALASDRIYRELLLLREKMPIIVSMGDVAASGGYFLAAAGDTIVAQPNTITGSIGVFGLYPNMQGLLNDKLGIYFDGVKTGEYSALGSIDKPMTPQEKAIVQQYVEEIYADFTSIVHERRGIPISAMDSIAEGRVWAGSDALRLGLVDLIGSFETALAIAAEKANIESYRLVHFPKLKNPLEMILSTNKEAITQAWLKRQLGSAYYMVRDIQQSDKYMGMQMRLPYSLMIR